MLQRLLECAIELNWMELHFNVVARKRQARVHILRSRRPLTMHFHVIYEVLHSEL